MTTSEMETQRRRARGFLGRAKRVDADEVRKAVDKAIDEAQSRVPDDVRKAVVKAIDEAQARVPDDVDVRRGVRLPEVRLPEIRVGSRMPKADDLGLDKVGLEKLRGMKLPNRVDLPGRYEIRRRNALRVPAVAIAALAGLAGAVATLLFDPRMGRSRRAYARDRAAGLARRFGRQAARTGRWLASDAAGLRQRVASLADKPEPLDEVALAHKVETELFRDPAVDKGRLNINAEGDVVFLRGTASTPEEINRLEARVRDIGGVRHVVNLLHLPEADAPSEPFGMGAGARS